MRQSWVFKPKCGVIVCGHLLLCLLVCHGGEYIERIFLLDGLLPDSHSLEEWKKRGGREAPKGGRLVRGREVFLYLDILTMVEIFW